MTDTLIARLRFLKGVCDEAADRIEALQAELENEQRKVTAMVEGYEADAATIKELRAEQELAGKVLKKSMDECFELHAEVEALRDDNARLQRDLEFAVGVEPNVGRPKLSLDRQEPLAWIVYAKDSRRYFTLTFDVNKVPEIYVGGEALPLFLAAQTAPTKEQT